MVLPAIGLGVSVLGSILGGRSQKKAANRAAAQARADNAAAAAAAVEDQKRALEYRAADEARLRAATGFDFSKLVTDARAAGFNPLTALMATGGSGYDGRGAVLTSPFIGRAGFASEAAANNLSASQAVVNAAGYFGRSMGLLGQGLFEMGGKVEAPRLPKKSGGKGGILERAVSSTRKGSVPAMQTASKVTASPVASTVFPNGLSVDWDQTITPVFGANGPYLQDNRLSDAEMGAARYGELGEIYFGLKNVAADFRVNLANDWRVARENRKVRPKFTLPTWPTYDKSSAPAQFKEDFSF